MKIRTSAGTILESSNDLVVAQWKKHGGNEVSTEHSEENHKSRATRRKKE